MSFLKELNDKKLRLETSITRDTTNKMISSNQVRDFIKKNEFSKDINKFEKNLTKSNSTLIRCNYLIETNILDFDFDNKNFTMNQAEISLRNFFSQNKDIFIKRLIKGPPECFRWISWVIASEIPENRNNLLFINLLNQNIDKKTDTQIKKDLNRTLSQENYFIINQTQNSLYKVLRCYANFDKEVSYCQGMNFIVGFLLIISEFNELDTLYMIMSLFTFTFGDKNLGLRGFFIDEFPLLKLYIYQFEKIFQTFVPKLKLHFEELEVPNELWISKWFQTLFTICLPIECIVRVWDCIYAFGPEFMFNFSIALLVKHENNLLGLKEISDISQYFGNMNPYLTKPDKMIIFNIEELISRAQEIKISKKLLYYLRAELEQSSKTDFSMLKMNNEVKSKEFFNIFEKINSINNSDNMVNYNFNVKLDSDHRISLSSKNFTSDGSSLIKTEQLDSIYSYENDDETRYSTFSEFDLIDDDAVAKNLKAHTLHVKEMIKNQINSNVD